MEILLIIRFCCNCTYGNPGAPPWEVACLKPSGGWPERTSIRSAGFRGCREGRTVVLLNPLTFALWSAWS